MNRPSYREDAYVIQVRTVQPLLPLWARTEAFPSLFDSDVCPLYMCKDVSQIGAQTRRRTYEMAVPLEHRGHDESH